MHFEIAPQQAEDFRKNFKLEDFKFKLDPKQLDELKQRTNELGKAIPQQFNFNLSEKQLKDMIVVQTIIVPRTFDEQQQQMMKRERDALKQQKEEMKALGFGDHI
jgi:small-conductance mechanosensitive channel